MGKGTVILIRSLVVLTLMASAAGGCATVAVYEPVDAAEITFAQPNASLRLAADEYCETTRDRGLARGESTLGGLAGALLGKESTADQYWSAIDGDENSSATSAARIQADLTNTSSGLEALTGMAIDLVQTGAPGRTDVSKFESALIHARQSRQSLSEAIKRVSLEAATADGLEAGLRTLDDVIERAVATADRLAETRTSNEVARIAGSSYPG